ncbi:hypothetical protein CHS0354_004588, partial [Potamilus streckersoni]
MTVIKSRISLFRKFGIWLENYSCYNGFIWHGNLLQRLYMAWQPATTALYGMATCYNGFIWHGNLLQRLYMAWQPATTALYGMATCYNGFIWHGNLLQRLYMAWQPALRLDEYHYEVEGVGD